MKASGTNASKKSRILPDEGKNRATDPPPPHFADGLEERVARVSGTARIPHAHTPLQRGWPTMPSFLPHRFLAEFPRQNGVRHRVIPRSRDANSAHRKADSNSSCPTAWFCKRRRAPTRVQNRARDAIRPARRSPWSKYVRGGRGPRAIPRNDRKRFRCEEKRDLPSPRLTVRPANRHRPSAPKTWPDDRQSPRNASFDRSDTLPR